MARDRVFALLVGGMLAAYAALLWTDRVNHDDENRSGIILAHQRNAAAIPAIKGLILGGSNAYFSLSAQLLSSGLHEPWYNASLLDEGFSWSAYKAFIVALSQALDREQVRVVVYSSVHRLWALGTDDGSESSVDITGRPRWSARPYRSAISYAGHYLRTGSFSETRPRYPLPNEFGDFDFSEYRCTFGGSSAEFRMEAIDRASRDLAERARFLKSVFPSARIVLIVPSELAGPATRRLRDRVNQKLRVAFAEQISQEPFAADLTLLVQESFAGTEQICDVPHHANRDGRRWRTQGLIEMLGGATIRADQCCAFTGRHYGQMRETPAVRSIDRSTR